VGSKAAAAVLILRVRLTPKAAATVADRHGSSPGKFLVQPINDQ
jgi:hypothetical protein